MTTNQPNQQVEVEIGPQGVGHTTVSHDSQEIEMVKVQGPHGVPHVLPLEDGKALIQVLGALPDGAVTVVFYVEEKTS